MSGSAAGSYGISVSGAVPKIRWYASCVVQTATIGGVAGKSPEPQNTPAASPRWWLTSSTAS